jgi:hypothetical protein
MRSHARIVLGLLLLGFVLVPTAMATNGNRTVPDVQTAIVNFAEPTRIGDVIVMGPVVIVHDDRMYVHEPCTTVYRFEPGVGARELLTMFACIPREAKSVEKFTMRTDRDPMVGCAVLTEFQFAGDPEAHGVPITVE